MDGCNGDNQGGSRWPLSGTGQDFDDQDGVGKDDNDLD